MPRVERQGDNIIVRGVPVFDEHVDAGRPDPLKKVDASTLERICAATNERLKTEYELPLAAGWHTPGKGDSFAPPPVTGGYRNLRVDDFQGRKAIFADFRIPASSWKDASCLQRRSVEVFPTTMELDTCVLLGSKAPSRDLGPLTPPVHYDRANGAPVRYEMNGAVEDESMGEDIPAGGGNAELLQAISAMLDAKVPELVKAALNEALAGGEEQPPMEEPGIGDELPPELMEGAGDEGAPPAEEPAPEEPMSDEDKKKEEYQRHDLAVKYERLQKRFVALEAKQKETEGRERAEKYERRVSDLQAQGFAVEKAKLLPELMALDNDKARDFALEQIQKYGRKETPSFGFHPTQYGRTDDPVRYQGNPSGMTKANGELTPEQAKAAQQWARQNKRSYDEGRAHVLANGAA